MKNRGSNPLAIARRLSDFEGGGVTGTKFETFYTGRFDFGLCAGLTINDEGP